MIAKVIVLCFIAGAFAFPDFIPARPQEPTWKASKDYLTMRTHTINSRDHGCVDLPKKEEGSHICVNIWLKNRFSSASPAVKPSHVYLDYEYAKDHYAYSYRPVVTWVENINPWRIRGCVAYPAGHKHNHLSEGKLRWLALYSPAQTSQEQYGIIDGAPQTTNKKCYSLTFPRAFPTTPTVKFQIKLKYGWMTAQNAMVVWAKGVSNSGATYCLEEFYAWARYHHDFEIQWYAVSGNGINTNNPHSEDNFSTHNKVVFNANDPYPADHRTLNYFYCRNVTLPNWYYPCPTILVQAVEPNMGVCESTLVAWVAYHNKGEMTVCYADKRGIMGVRKTNVEVHYIVYGIQDQCQNKVCPTNQECVHPTWNTVACGCYKECKDGGEMACGTNMMTYENRCKLEKAACESGYKFSYAHHGKCEANAHTHGRDQLQAVSGCDGLYCKVISTRDRIWYKDAPINVQIAVNWNNDINMKDPSTHDATASWVEDVKPESFKACVMEAGRKTLAKGPYVNWLAYQGHVDKIMTSKIEVGEWRSGTHCVPLHERKTLEKPMADKPPSCPRTDLDDKPSGEDKFHYDSHLMSRIHGQHQHEWFKRMLNGYGVKKLNLTNGMHLDGATVMLTVEQHIPQSGAKSTPRDAINAWIEYDGASKEAYVCLREMQNWDGKHEGVHVYWTLFMDKASDKDKIFPGPPMPSVSPSVSPTMSSDAHMAQELKEKMENAMMNNELGFIHKIPFKPAMMAPEDNNYAFCQTKQYLPANFTRANSASVLVSVSHRIPAHAAFESMKKYQLHQMEIMKGMPIGDMEFNKDQMQPSWMLPHMWRANLTGWRPHMRIGKNTDYSAWVEGMNGTHIRVCQKSVYSGFHYEGVMVNLMVMPDRCPSGYEYFKGACSRLSPKCESYTDALTECSKSSDKLAVPKDYINNVFVSYLSKQSLVHVAKSDRVQEGDWRREYPEDVSTYNRWAENEPSSGVNLDCAVQSGKNVDFTEKAGLCSSCENYVCTRPAPALSCDFPMNYCMNGGKCSYMAGNLSCMCTPPYKGARCEEK